MNFLSRLYKIKNKKNMRIREEINMIPISEMKRLVYALNDATEQYDAGNPQISDVQWDSWYFELKQLEHETGIVLPNSPTQNIHYKSINQLENVKHNHLMLSLDKTKSSKDIADFLGDKDYICMGKMDGLTLSLRYINGVLTSAETRGDGKQGKQVLHNALTVWNIPKSIKGMRGELVVDGEIICTYDDFEKFKDKYKNPRNFASGSIQLLDANECSRRKLTFVAWDAVKGCEYNDTLSDRLETLKSLGFTVVPFVTQIGKYKNPITNIAEEVFELCKQASYPVDGLVFKFDNCEYYTAQGRTDHHFKGGIAFKRYEEEVATTLRDIEWQLGRSGVLTPVAIFDEIEIGGTAVSRASLHNISVMDSLYPNLWYDGLKITVIKAHEIIPQLSGAYRDGCVQPNVKKLLPPKLCPYCGKPTILKDNSGVKTLYCSNNGCRDRVIAQIEHFCSKKGMDITGLSTATLQKLYQANWINNIEDIFNLSTYKNEWIKMAGFGEKSVEKILAAIDASRRCSLETFITALGIPLIGRTVAKEIVKRFPTYGEFRDAIDNQFDFSSLPTFAEAKTKALLTFDYRVADRVYSYLMIDLQEQPAISDQLSGLTVSITGKLNLYKNRAELKEVIERAGGKVTDSISKKVQYLINNDNTSTTAKNTKAKELGIEILTEEEFTKKFLNI